MSGFIPPNEPGWTNVYPQQVAPDKSPDAAASKVDQKQGSTLYNLIQRPISEGGSYKDANGTIFYQFKSNQERMLYKYGQYRAQNVASGAYSNYPNYGQGT
jgi:hypothetical protein